jgi:hypothetical protein
MHGDLLGRARAALSRRAPFSLLWRDLVTSALARSPVCQRGLIREPDNAFRSTSDRSGGPGGGGHTLGSDTFTGFVNQSGMPLTTSSTAAAFRCPENGVSGELHRFARVGLIDRISLGSMDPGLSDRSAATRVRRSPAVPPLVSPPGSTCSVYGRWPTRRPGTCPRPASAGPDPDLIRGTSRTLVVLSIRGSGSGFGVLRDGRWALRVWSGS